MTLRKHFDVEHYIRWPRMLSSAVALDVFNWLVSNKFEHWWNHMKRKTGNVIYCTKFAEMKEPVPPIMNDKIKYITIRLEESVVIPCVAYANPRPVFR